MTVTISSLSNNSLGGNGGEISYFNNEGVAVGTDGGAAIWQNGKVSALTGLDYALSVNDSGTVAGITLNLATFTLNAAVLQNGTVTLLPSLGGTVTPYSETANGINDSGLVVGASAAPGGLDEACLWQNGVATNLGTLPGGNTPLGEGYYNSTALAINASGQIVGFSLTTGNVYHATLWQNGAITDLGVFAAGDQSFATAINSQGEIVGYDMPPAFNSKAFLWQNGKMTNLGTLPGDDYSTAEAINDSGIIVGQAGLYANPAGNHAVMWQNGKIIDLNTLLAPNSGWFLQTADGINDSGVIVGRGGQTNGSGDGTYEMILNGTVAVIGSTVQSVLQTGVTTPSAVVDSGANVLAGLDGLQTLSENGLLDSITLTDASTPHWTLTPTQLDADSGALAALLSPVSLTVSGNVSALAATSLPSAVTVATPLSVNDDATNIADAFDGLEKAVKAGTVGTITLTDGDYPPLVLSIQQYQQDGDALSHIAGSFTLYIGDSADNIGTNLDFLQSLVASAKIGEIDLSYSASTAPQTISLSSAQLANDQAALDVIDATFDLSVTPSSATASVDGTGYAVTVVLSGTAASYTATSSGDGTSFTLSGNGESHQMTGVVALQFSDHTEIVASQTPATAGGVSSAQVASLYSAVFAREPDVNGLAFYEAVAHSGKTGIVTFAEYFLNSQEYTGNTAHAYAETAAGDAQFITDIYSNLLHRAPDTGAVAFYQSKVINPMLAGLTAGTTAYSNAELAAHATVLTYFSNSAEFLGDVSVSAQHPADASHWLLMI